MANRRMFAKSITKTGKFLRMPQSSRLLYYDLGMEADDDGVVEAFAVMRTTGASEDDLRVLAAKGYVTILDEDLLSYINDWKVNNFIRSDRYTPSIHQDKLIELAIPVKFQVVGDGEEDGMPLGIPDGIPEVDPGKDRLSKDNLGKDIDIDTDKKASNDAKDRINYKEIKNMYNAICISLPKVEMITDARRKAINARYKEYGLDGIKEVFEAAEASDWLAGRKGDWSADFDWLMRPNNFVKVIEGNYKNKKGTSKPAKASTNPFMEMLEGGLGNDKGRND